MNNTGIAPLDIRCLVLPDPVEDKIGNIVLPDSVREKNEWKQQRCTLIAAGASAFAEWLDAPEPGARVFVDQYSGSRIVTDSGETYWLIKDFDIIGKVIA